MSINSSEVKSNNDEIRVNVRQNYEQISIRDISVCCRVIEINYWEEVMALDVVVKLDLIIS